MARIHAAKQRTETLKTTHEAELAAADERHKTALDAMRHELMGGAQATIEEARGPARLGEEIVAQAGREEVRIGAGERRDIACGSK